MGDSIIELREVVFSYPTAEDEQPRQVIKGIDLDIERGSFVALVGHNGSGKSTLARLLNGMLKPDSGIVRVNGMDTADETLEIDIRRSVGMVFQNPDNQLVATIVEEDVAFGPENLGIPSEEIRRRVDEALKTTGMYEYRHRPPHKLSGGQKQRVAIAGIIAMRPECIVLDEPTAMLDPRGRAEVMSTIARLNRENGITVILVTHYMDEAALCDRVIVMNDGVLAVDNPPRVLFGRVPELLSLGLDVPQPVELIYRLREEGLKLPENILTVKECIGALKSLLKL